MLLLAKPLSWKKGLIFSQIFLLYKIIFKINQILFFVVDSFKNFVDSCSYFHLIVFWFFKYKVFSLDVVIINFRIGFVINSWLLGLTILVFTGAWVYRALMKISSTEESPIILIESIFLDHYCSCFHQTLYNLCITFVLEDPSILWEEKLVNITVANFNYDFTDLSNVNEYPNSTEIYVWTIQLKLIGTFILKPEL